MNKDVYHSQIEGVNRLHKPSKRNQTSLVIWWLISTAEFNQMCYLYLGNYRKHKHPFYPCQTLHPHPCELNINPNHTREHAMKWLPGYMLLSIYNVFHLGASAPWNLVRLTRGLETNAASGAIKSNGSKWALATSTSCRKHETTYWSPTEPARYILYRGL